MKSQKMDKTKAGAVVNYQQKKGATTKEIHEDMVQILSEESPSYVTVNSWLRNAHGAGLEQKMTLGQVVQKPQLLMNKLMVFPVTFLMIDVILFHR